MIIFYMQTCFIIKKNPILYTFFAKFIYNEYTRPYILSHVVSTIFASDLPEVAYVYVYKKFKAIPILCTHI